MTDPHDATPGFAEKILPVLDRFEAQRKKCLRKWAVSVVVIAALCLGGGFFIAQKNSEPGEVMIFAAIITFFASAGAFYFNTNSYKANFKSEVIGAVVQAYQEGLRYFPGRAIQQQEFSASKLFLKGIDRYSGEDFVTGICGKTKFEFSEVHAQYKTTSRDSKGGTKTEWHTIFNGIFFIADFNKKFRTHTVVLPDTAEKMFGFLGKKLQALNFSRAELVKLEDPEFEREFCVYGEDQVEARYILSTSLMRRILDYKKKFGATMYLSFIKSKVYVALSTNKNHFEPRLFRAVNNLSLIDEYRNDLELIIGIVEDLNLNTRIWSKQ